MVRLVEALERFNRKERNLLMQHIIGYESKPPLHPDFCFDLERKIGLHVPLTAWWATDYHISWLAGALALCTKRENAIRIIWTEPKGERRIAERNQEDIDLLICTDSKLVLIEAKRYGSWDNSQLNSKLKHIDLVKNYFENINDYIEGIEFYYLLMSPQKPKNLKVQWPKWVRLEKEAGDVSPQWIPLHLPLCRQDILEVGQCDERGVRIRGGARWGIFGLNGKIIEAAS